MQSKSPDKADKKSTLFPFGSRIKMCVYKLESECNKKISLSVEKKIGGYLHLMLYLNTLLRPHCKLLCVRPMPRMTDFCDK